jgi:hypothetical protein
LRASPDAAARDCNSCAIYDPGWPSILTIHFQSLIFRPALCNARGGI